MSSCHRFDTGPQADARDVLEVAARYKMLERKVAPRDLISKYPVPHLAKSAAGVPGRGP